MADVRKPPLLMPLVALALAGAHVGYEFFHGGVKTHHFLARGDLPGFSNWLGLVILPLLGLAFGLRVGRAEGGDRGSRSPGMWPVLRAGPRPWVGLVAALAHGAALAASFHWGQESLSLALFAGLFLAAAMLPVYRAEYLLGFVLGMMVIFGSVIPLVFALFFAMASYVVRRAAAWGIVALRTMAR